METQLCFGCSAKVYPSHMRFVKSVSSSGISQATARNRFFLLER